MNSIDKKKKKKIKLNSDAFPKNIAGILEDKIFAVSDIHNKIRYENLKIEKESIYYKELTKNDISEIVKLHREWFPVEYTKEFYLDLFVENSIKIRKNIIAIGAFIKVEEKEYIIGSILCELKNEKNFYNATKIKINQKSICEKIFDLYEFCYIMTIGIIDECRNLGLGSKLLNEVINTIKTKRKKCMAIYLHVIEYNSVAIRFYLKNEFIECNNIRNYYYINKTYFNGKVLCKLFSNNNEEIKLKETISYLDEPDSDPNFIYNIIHRLVSLVSKIFCCLKKKY
jgi:ribosomal protein S18 acetylase RimI-like enzyme